MHALMEPDNQQKGWSPQFWKRTVARRWRGQMGKGRRQKGGVEQPG